MLSRGTVEPPAQIALPGVEPVVAPEGRGGELRLGCLQHHLCAVGHQARKDGNRNGKISRAPLALGWAKHLLPRDLFAENLVFIDHAGMRSPQEDDVTGLIWLCT